MLETSLSQEEEALVGVSETREEEFSKNKTVLEICRKRKRPEEEEDEEENDGFRTPTRPENRIPEPKECPPAPRRDRTEYSEMLLRAKTTTSCRRRLNFPPEDVVNSFITDLQRRTTTTAMKSIKK